MRLVPESSRPAAFLSRPILNHPNQNRPAYKAGRIGNILLLHQGYMSYIQLNPCLHIMLRAVYINCQAAFNIFFNRESSNTELTAESRSLYIVRRDTPKSAAI